MWFDNVLSPWFEIHWYMYRLLTVGSILHALQILQSMDVLKKSPKLNMADLELPDTIGALHTLYSMTLTPIGQLQNGIIVVTCNIFTHWFCSNKKQACMHARTHILSAFCKHLLEQLQSTESFIVLELCKFLCSLFCNSGYQLWWRVSSFIALFLSWSNDCCYTSSPSY